MRRWRESRFLITILAAAGSAVLAGPLLQAGASRGGPPLETVARQPNQTPRAPDTPQAAVQRPTFRAAANLVRVDVYPTSDGRLVPGLSAEDFEVQEDGVPQQIATFEFVRPRPADPAGRPSVAGDRGARADAAAPGERVFVLFLDTYHVSQGAAFRIRQSLTTVLDRVLAAGDRVALMTPEMSGGDITFWRRGESIAAAMDAWWKWGRRDYRPMSDLDAREKMYAGCYPPGRA